MGFDVVSTKERGEALETYRDGLQPIVFQAKSCPESMKSNDEAYLRHLATAIIENVAGFITSDQAILRASSELEEAFGLKADKF